MKFKKIALMVAAGSLSASAFATNGYFSHGYGLKAKGMAGVATTSSDDAMGGANNPASMVWAGDRMDIGLDWFGPKREASRSGSAFGGNFDGSATSGSNNFYIPEFGYNRMLGSDKSFGITVYGNGGMNTDYPSNTLAAGHCGAAAANLFCGSSRLGVDLMQLIIAPTFSMKLNNNNSIGISPLIGYQRFSADGLQAFALGSSNPGSLTNNGHDNSHGYGLRLGWLGKLSDTVTLGADYATRMHMSKFSKYSGLFADGGSFDMPENYNLGISWKATPQLKLALDYQQINYGKVPSIANPSTNPALFGTANGPGFGWGNVAVTKLGAEYQYSNDLTLRAGYSWGQNPIQSRDAALNILAPGVVKNHITLGLTQNVGGGELTVAYMHAYSNSVSGLDGNFGGTDTIKMYENSLGVSYGWKFK